MSWRWRRLWWARWVRLTRWEFWPMMVAHTPVIVTLLWQAVRHRKWAIFMNANPVMEGGGVSSSGKGDMLELLREVQKPGGVEVARFLKVRRDGESELRRVREFMDGEGVEFPMVMKPVQGERGFGVKIVRAEADVREWLREWRHDFLIQELIGGLEFGVHWSWMPGEEKGKIESICGKKMQKLIGDGQSTLEELILADDRAVLMAKCFFRKYANRLQEVLEKGEVFELVNMGTHSLGAVFSDERSLLTEDLLKVFDELGMACRGLHIGRYDVKVPSREAFQKGEGIRVIELNGVTGVPSHIYEPNFPLIAGMKDFCREWVRACQIGKKNLHLGRCDRGFYDLWDVWMGHLENRRK